MKKSNWKLINGNFDRLFYITRTVSIDLNGIKLCKIP